MVDTMFEDEEWDFSSLSDEELEKLLIAETEKCRKKYTSGNKTARPRKQNPIKQARDDNATVIDLDNL